MDMEPSVWTPPRSTLSANFNDQLDKLVREHDLSYFDDSFFSGSGDGIVLLLDDPDTAPESWDMAVIFPELLVALDVRPRAAVALTSQAQALQSACGIGRLPSLLFLCDGSYVGVIEGLRDWAELEDEAKAMMNKPVGRAPIGIAVASSTSCGHGGAR
ncbi:MAG: hypothetical protein LBE24_08590 [Methylobacillus sp.]|jgi:hydrogenase-1 operon protein HyaE|nr:hypothetical protein [Methylobacillus sp.]